MRKAIVWLMSCAAATDQTIVLQRMEFVGPQVGDELREQGGLAMLLALGSGSDLCRLPIPN